MKKHLENKDLPGMDDLEYSVEEIRQDITDIMDYEKIMQGKQIYTHDTVAHISHILRSKIQTFRRIMVVEDDPKLFVCMIENFKNKFNVYYETNGRKALKNCKWFHCHIWFYPAVDDEQYIPDMMINSFRDHKHYVITCERSAIQAIELARENNFDISIIDYQMSTVNGIELLEVMQEIYKDKGYVSILCTAHAI